MLRGPQTLGELKQRTERMQHFDSLEAVEATLDALGGRAAGREARAPAGPEGAALPPAARRRGGAGRRVVRRRRRSPTSRPPPAPPAVAADPELERQVARLEDEVAHLREAIDALRDELGA